MIVESTLNGFFFAGLQDNIVIDSEGHALLTDFGLSKEGVLDYTEGAKSFCGYEVLFVLSFFLKMIMIFFLE